VVTIVRPLALVAGHQIGMLLDPERMFIAYPAKIADSGGALGRLLYGSQQAYWATLATMLPWFVVRACRRMGQELGRMQPT
jgi:hypothetical protein